MLLPLPRYLASRSDIEALPPGEGRIINSGPLALRKVSDWDCWLGIVYCRLASVVELGMRGA